MVHADLDALKTDQAARLEEISALKKQLNNLNAEVDTRRKTEEELVADRAAQATELQQQLVQLGQERKYKLDLEKRLVNLELSKAILKESISRCLMHRFWGWAARLQTRIRQIFRPLSTRGKAEDEIALKQDV
jgi:chromosome segregation ATPase